MNILLWVILGGIAGWLASIVMKTNSQQGIFGDILMGILGAVVAGFVATLFGGTGVTGFNIYSLLLAVAGAMGLIWVRRRMFSYK